MWKIISLVVQLVRRVYVCDRLEKALQGETWIFLLYKTSTTKGLSKPKYVYTVSVKNAVQVFWQAPKLIILQCVPFTPAHTVTSQQLGHLLCEEISKFLDIFSKMDCILNLIFLNPTQAYR